MTNKKLKYSEKDIKGLGDIEVIRTNPGMFINNSDTPTHLVEEVLDNSLDECDGGNASIIAVNIDTINKIYTVIDNGRGIPIGNDTPVYISTKLYTGAKFRGSKTAYEISCGLHGCGLVAVNALSEFYKIEIYRDKQHAIFEFENAKLKRKKIEEFNGEPPFSTKIQIKPDKTIFESVDINIDKIRRRLTTASAEIGNGNIFILNVDGKKEIFKFSLVDNFKMHCFEKDEDHTEIIDLNVVEGKETIKLLMCYSLSSSPTPKTLSSVNLLPVEDGGTHINLLYDVLRDFFSSKAKKINYIFNSNDCLVGLRCYIIVRLLEPEFGGQAKFKLINKRADLDKFAPKLSSELSKYFDSNNEYLFNLLKRFKEYRDNIVSKSLTKSTTKRTSTKLTRLRDCSSPNGELFIVEGDSAAGGLINMRSPAFHAILPLKGKIPNVVNKKDILKSVIVQDLMHSLGTGINGNFNINNLRYSKIIAAKDSDPDGGHIAALVAMIISVLTPGIIESGKFYLVNTPLFAINENKVFIPLWTKEELDKAREDKRHITRFKGLGEMTPFQLKECILNKDKRKLVKVEKSSNLQTLIKLFSDSEMKRKLLDDTFWNKE